MKSLYDVTELFRTLEIANRGSRPFLTFLAGLREELTALLPADFLIRYDEGRLLHIGRYLRALALRAERGGVHLEKALVRGKEKSVNLATGGRSTLRELPSYASEEKRKAIEDLVWMIEEYKVSLFAQELKTPFPISRKRLDARMEEIERMLQRSVPNRPISPEFIFLQARPSYPPPPPNRPLLKPIFQKSPERFFLLYFSFFFFFFVCHMIVW